MTCRCGHVYEAHLHHRSGSDCAQCICARFRLNYKWAFSVTTFLLRTSRIWRGTRRWLYRLTICLIWDHRAKFSSYPYCLRCGKRVDK